MRALRNLEGLGERIRLAAAAPILALLAVVDSVSWLVSFCVDLAVNHSHQSRCDWKELVKSCD